MQLKNNTNYLKKKIRMREREITKVLHDLEKTYAGCQKQLEQKLTPKKPQRKEQSQGGESATVQNIVNTSVKRSEEQEQNGNLRIQSATPFQPCSSSTTFNSSGAAAFYPSSSFVYSSTPVTSQFSMSDKPSVWDQPLHFQQPPLNARLNSAQTTLVESSAIRPSVVSSSQLYMPAAQARTSFQPLSSSNQVQFSTPIVSQPLSASYDHISIDSTAALKRVSIPNFSGNKKSYDAWKAAFYALC